MAGNPNSASYPPAFSQCCDSCVTIGAERSQVLSTFRLQNALLRFNTSSLPDAANIVSASLTVYVTSVANGDARSLSGDWFSWSPSCDSTDYSVAAGTNALSTSGNCGSACQIAMISGGTRTFSLDNANSNVSRTGNTHLRLHVTGGQPTAENFVYFAAQDHASLPAPVLNVCHN
jgi:hypothetical protein